MDPVKQQLYELCQSYLAKRIATAKEAIQTAQSSANEETKSSAGDKYETGRAMMELEVEQNTTQLNEAVKLKQQLDQISPRYHSATIQTGSLVVTNHGTYFIAISAGKLSAGGRDYFAVSPDSPIGLKLKGLKQGDTFVFGNRNYQIQEVW